MKNLSLLFMFSLFLAQIGNSQTYVSGGIYNNTTWTVVTAPYIVTGDLVLFPNATLTIEPGVLVKFYDNVGFEVRGTLISDGTPLDTIHFESFSSYPYKGEWSGIYINNNLGGKGSFTYCRVKDADIGIQNICCSASDTLKITKCRFENNNEAVGGYGGDYAILSIDNCYFIHNNTSITGADKFIINSIFVYNFYGTRDIERTKIYDCHFCGNHTAVNAHYGELKNSTIINNNIGVEGTLFFGGDIYINTGNIIAQNDTGVIISLNSIGPNNIICDNNYYNLVTTTSENIPVINQCWCLNDSSQIAQKIYDGYKNPHLGLINFIPFINCDSSVLPDTSYCPEIPAGIIASSQTTDTHLKTSPNPFSDYTILEFETLGNTDHSLYIYNSLGQLKVVINNIKSKKLRFNRESLPSGLYFVYLRTETKIVSTGTFIID